MLGEAALMKDLTDQERLMFQTEMGTRRKNPTTGVVLALFLGGFGAHRSRHQAQGAETWCRERRGVGKRLMTGEDGVYGDFSDTCRV